MNPLSPDRGISRRSRPSTTAAQLTSAQKAAAGGMYAVAMAGYVQPLAVRYDACVAFGQLGENVAESLVKGTAVIVTGHAAQEEWETKDGQKRRPIRVTAEEVAPSLRWASAKVIKVNRSRTESIGSSQRPGGSAPDPWTTDGPGVYSDEPPF